MAASNTIEIPESVPISAQTLDDLEDWMAGNHPELLKRILTFRKHCSAGFIRRVRREMWRP